MLRHGELPARREGIEECRSPSGEEEAVRSKRFGRAAVLSVAVMSLIVGGSSANIANAASRHIAVNVFLNPDCAFWVTVSAEWSPAPGQARITFEFEDLNGGGGGSSGPIDPDTDHAEDNFGFPSATGIHRFAAVVTITDSFDKVLMSGHKKIRLDCGP
jgi:hypothetical protein